MKLSTEERNLLEAAKRNVGGFHLATKWYFRGWDPLPYQYVWHHMPVGNTTTVAGIGCIAADTRIGGAPVGDLVGSPVDVVSHTGRGFLQAKANPPFLKGKADLYRVILSDGRSITVTLEHKFLTQSGYRRLRDLSVGSWIGVQPIPEQTTRVSDARHSTETTANYSADCSGDCRQHGEQLRLAPGNVQDSVPSRGDVRERIPQSWRVDGLVVAQEYTHACPQHGHQTKTDFDVHAERLRDHEKCFFAPETPGHALRLVLQSSLRFHSNFGHRALAEQSLPHKHQGDLASALFLAACLGTQSAFQDVCEHQSAWRGQSPDTLQQHAMFQAADIDRRDMLELGETSLCAFPYDTSYRCGNCSTDVLFVPIKSIDFVKHGEFYDLHVPVWNNYVANGIINHNSGKTSMVAASYTMDCMTHPGFRALNASVTAKQAELAFQMVDGWREQNPRFDKWITDITLRPYPIIHFANSSVFEFRTAGQGAKFIRGSEYDRINFDEPQLDPSDEAVRTLRGRLRGRRPDGSVRMARLDCTGTPSYAVWLRERFYKGLRGSEYATPETLKYFWSLRIETYDNIRLTPEQIQLIEADYPPELIDIELRGHFPDYGLSMFSIKNVEACTDANINDEVDEALHPEDGKVKPGYDLIEWPRVGEIKLELPLDPRSVYIIAGDPGVDSPPKRNSGVVMVADVTDPNDKKLVYFHWVPGKGSYHPFMSSYKYGVQKYRPIMKGIDSTGPQKALDELGFQDYGMVLDDLNFAALKQGMLNTLLADISSHTWRLPRIQGLIQQLTTYRPEDDKKLAQDLVMTLAMLAWLARSAPTELHVSGAASQYTRNRRQRSNQSSRRR